MTNKQWEYLGNIEIAVPLDMVDTYGPGSWDEAAAVFGPQLAELNPDIQWQNVALELDEYGLDRDWDEQTAWQYAAWIIAGDIYDKRIEL